MGVDGETGAQPGEAVAGQHIGKYQVIRRIARGGMAELLLARSTGIEGFQKVVVLKRILPQLAHDADFVEMFLAEARLAATLEHPNIVPVFDFGRAGSDYFFTMPYVHGRDLLAILRQLQVRTQRLPLGQVVSIALGVAAGLHYAHEQVGFDGEPLRIVHRDISPANVMVTYEGHIKVADFGIAKAAAQTNVTKVGVRKGKAAYMSPEQIRGEPIDRRSDVFALGVVLWEMATMRRLFRGDNDLAIMHRIVHEVAPPPSSASMGIPTAFDAIVGRCLHPSPNGRYATAREVQGDLERFAEAQGLSLSARHLAELMVGLFGPQELPWASSTAMPALGAVVTPTPLPAADPATRAPALAPGPPATPAPAMAPVAASPANPAAADSGFAASPGTDHAHRTDEVTASEALELPAYGGGPRTGAMMGAGVGLLAAAAIALAIRGGDPPPPVATSASPEGAGDTVAPAPTRPELPGGSNRDALNLVNQPDRALALDYARRHAVLAWLRADPALASGIDGRVTTAMDLVQAADADEPCAVYADALGRIEVRPDPFFHDALRTPAPSGCDELEARRAAAAATLQGGAPPPGDLPPDAAAVAAPTDESAPSPGSGAAPRRPRRDPARPGDDPPPSPDSAPSRLDDGLRPFGEG